MLMAGGILVLFKPTARIRDIGLWTFIPIGPMFQQMAAVREKLSPCGSGAIKKRSFDYPSRRGWRKMETWECAPHPARQRVGL
jgi:hypothetical protein